jgi:BirA family biotin operon repressor/biotin-[acetyl-CoA-carboxylase] ligase
LIEGRKVCGILIETVGESAVIGIGINVNEREFPDELHAVSIQQALGKEVARETILLGVWASLMELMCREPPAVAEEVWERLAWRDREVETTQGLRGRIRGFGENAELNVESADRLVQVAAADGVRLVE